MIRKIGYHSPSPACAPPVPASRNDLVTAHLRLLTALLALTGMARAGVVTDGTVGPAGSIGKIGQDFSIPASLGTKAGGNLFHSFSELNLLQGESATFSGPGDVQNILARVRGPESSIDGTLRSTIPGANLFLINPNGVLFGPNAAVDVSGSFTVTTADFLKLSDGGRFDAKNPAADSLTSAPVSAFGFTAPARVRFNRTALTFADHSTFSVVAGNIDIVGNGVGAPKTIGGDGVSINLLSLRGAGEARLPGAVTTGLVDGFSTLGDISLTARAQVRTGGTRAGRVVLRSGSLVAVDQSGISSENFGATPAPPVDLAVRGHVTVSSSAFLTRTSSSAAAGDFSLRAGSLDLDTSSTIGSQALFGATITARTGHVRVEADSISIAGESSISGSTNGLGSGSVVEVKSRDLKIVGDLSDTQTGIFANTFALDGGRGGDVRVDAGTLSLSFGGSIAADTSGQARGGNVRVRADILSIAAHATSSDSVKTGIFADSLLAATAGVGGRGGDVTITAGTLRIADGGLISTKTVGLGAGGDTSVSAREMSISRGASSLYTGIAADAAAGATPTKDSEVPRTGSGGSVRVTADALHIFDGGQISANTATFGKGGSVSVHARSIDLTGRADGLFTGISAESLPPVSGGAGGNVEVVASQLRVLEGGGISANTNGAGAGGSVFVKADSILLSNPASDRFTAISAVSNSPTRAGRGGSIRVEARDLAIIGGGSISATTAGPGAAGDVAVAADSARLLAGGRISADTSGTGAGGSIVVKGTSLFISSANAQQRTGIFSRTLASGTGGVGGKVDIVERNITLTRGGAIVASSASSGTGGSINIDARKLALDHAASIEASATGRGVAGSVAIRVRDPLTLRSAAAIRTTSALSDAGTVSITSASAIDLLDSSITVQALLGNAGRIELIAPKQLTLRNSQLLAVAGLNGGDIFIDPEFVLLDHSLISANAAAGRGGNITLIADYYFNSETLITATGSQAGTIDIAAPELDLSNGLVSLPGGLIDASAQLRDQCARRLGADFSSFLVLGRGGIELSPTDPTPSVRRRAKSAPSQ